MPSGVPASHEELGRVAYSEFRFGAVFVISSLTLNMKEQALLLLQPDAGLVLPSSLSWHLVIRGTSTLSRSDLRRRGARARAHKDRLRNVGGLFPNFHITAYAWVHEWPFCRSGSGLLCVTETPLFKGQLNAAMLA